MVEKKSKPLVHLILNPSEISGDIPAYYTGLEGLFNVTGGLRSFDVNNINLGTLNEINTFIVNLDTFFENQFFGLTSALSANRYLSPLYDNFTKGWRILEILESYSEIFILVDDYEEMYLWKSFLLANNIEVVSQSKKVLNLKIKTLVREIIGFLKEYFWAKVTKKKSQPFSKIIFIHWINEKNKPYQHVINQSQYYGNFLKDVHKEVPVSIIGNILSGHPEFRDIIKSDCTFIKECLSFWDIVWSLFRSFKLLAPIRKKIVFKTYDFTLIVKHSLIKDFWEGSYLKHLLFYRAFKKILSNIDGNSTIIYPFENQPLEKALIMVCSDYAKKIKLLAYQFFPIPENFLIHHFSEKVKKHTLVPTKILTTDIYSDNFFRREFTETIKLGSVRYNHLLNYPVVFTAKNKILCSLFLDEIETISMVKKIVEMSKYIDCDFVLNYHPLLSANTLQKIKNFVKDSKNIRLSNMKVVDLLDNVFLLIYNSSSVFLEAALRGIAVLYLPCEDIVNLDRFHGCGKVIKNNSEMISFIEKLKGDAIFYEEYSKMVYQEANNMIIPYDKQAIEGLNL